MKTMELIKNILTTLYVEDGEVNPDKNWEVDTIEHVASALKDAGYTPEMALSINPHNRTSGGWTIDDVKSCMEEKYPHMTDRAARYILCTMEDKLNTSVGINWTVIADTIWDILWEIQYAAGHHVITTETEDTLAEDKRLRMRDTVAFEIFEGMVKDHGDKPKGISDEELQEAGKAWLKEQPTEEDNAEENV